MNKITTIISRMYFLTVGMMITLMMITAAVGYSNYGTQSAEFNTMPMASAILLVVSIIVHRLVRWAFFGTTSSTTN